MGERINWERVKGAIRIRRGIPEAFASGQPFDQETLANATRIIDKATKRNPRRVAEIGKEMSKDDWAKEEPLVILK